MKHVVITGSTRGIGFYMAKEFLAAGCGVTLSGRGEALPEAARSELKVFDKSYIYVPCDVQQKASVQNLWDESCKRWGSVDVWINNAGQNVPHEHVWKTEEAYTQNVIHTNLTGMIFGSQIAAEGMLKQGSGGIYSMEGLGSDGMIQRKTILYGTTKRALRYFMQALAKELEGTGVIAGRLSPGMMLTDFITKTPDGDRSEVIDDAKFVKLFNTLADRPETVARFFVPRILGNTKNNALIAWLTNGKAAWRFATAGLRKEKLM